MSSTPPRQHAFVAHLWKQGVCRECNRSASEHDVQPAAAVSPVADHPPTTDDTRASPTPALTPTIVIDSLPSDTAAVVVSDGFRKPQLSTPTAGPLGRVGPIPPPRPPTVSSTPARTSPTATHAPTRTQAFTFAAVSIDDDAQSAAAPTAESTITPRPVSTSLAPAGTSSPRCPPPQRRPPAPPQRAPPSVPPPVPAGAIATTAVAVAPAASPPIAPPTAMRPPPIPATVTATPPTPVTNARVPPPLRPSQAPAPTQVAVSVPPPPLTVIKPPPIPVSVQTTNASGTRPPPVPLPPPIAPPAITTVAAMPVTSTPLETPAPMPPPVPAPVAAPVPAPAAPRAATPPAVPAAPARPISSRLVDYFAVFGRGSPILGSSLVSGPPSSASLAQVRFQPRLLPDQRFPADDHRDSALSGNTASFCFPTHVRLTHVRTRDAEDARVEGFEKRRPGMHRFVLTKLDGSKQFCATLVIWERMSDDDIEDAMREIEEAMRRRSAQAGARAAGAGAGEVSPEQEARLSELMTALRASARGASQPLAWYSPKALTVVSSWPFFSMWEAFLRALFRVSHAGLGEATVRSLARRSPSHGVTGSTAGSGVISLESDPSAFCLVRLRLPLERLIANFVSEVPVPPPGVLQVRYAPPGCGRDGPALLLSRPPINQLPLCDVNWSLLFRAIDAPILVALFVAVATEQKVLLVSRHRALIAAACDAVAVLLFPFTWAGVYMPLLPEPMLEFLYAPVPFIAGIDAEIFESRSDDIPDDLVLVELDAPRIRLPDADALPQLPEGVYAKLLAHLKAHANIRDPHHPLVRLADQAFPFGQDRDRLEVDATLCANNQAEVEPPVVATAKTAPPPIPNAAIVPAAYQALSTAFEPVQTYRPIQRRASVPPPPIAAVPPPVGVTFGAPSTAPFAPAGACAEDAQLHVEDVRYGFLRLWCKLLARYDRFMPWGANANTGPGLGSTTSPANSPPSSPRGGPAAAPAPQADWFNTPAFLAASPRDARPFLSAFTRTQLFAKFIDDRIMTRPDVEAFNAMQAQAQAQASSPRANHSSSHHAHSHSHSHARGAKSTTLPHGVMSDEEDEDSGDERAGIAEEDEDGADGSADTTDAPSSASSSHAGSQTRTARSFSSGGSLTPPLGMHSRATSGVTVADVDLLPLCSTVPPPSAVSHQLDAADPVTMPVMHQIRFFDECILAKRNRRRQKLIGSIASGRIFGHAGFHETPFLHDATTAAERVLDTIAPDDTALSRRDFAYPVLHSTRAVIENSTTVGSPPTPVSVFPVFPTLDPTLFGVPRAPHVFATPTPTVTPLTAVTDETPTSPMRSATGAQEGMPALALDTPPLPSNKTHTSGLPPPGRTRGPVLPRAPSPRGRQVSLGTAASAVRGTPAWERTVVGARGSLSQFRAEGMQHKINQMASLLSFETFGAGIDGKTGPPPPPPPRGSVPLSQQPVSLLPPTEQGNKKLKKLMAKEREKQAKAEKKRLQQEAEKNKKNRREKDDKTATAAAAPPPAKKTPVVWTPPVYSSSKSVTIATTPVHATGTGGGVFSFASAAAAGARSPQLSSRVLHGGVGVDISSPVLSPVSSLAMPPPVPTFNIGPPAVLTLPSTVTSQVMPPPVPVPSQSSRQPPPVPAAFVKAAVNTAPKPPPPIVSVVSPVSGGSSHVTAAPTYPPGVRRPPPPIVPLLSPRKPPPPIASILTSPAPPLLPPPLPAALSQSATSR